MSEIKCELIKQFGTLRQSQALKKLRKSNEANLRNWNAIRKMEFSAFIIYNTIKCMENCKLLFSA